MVLLEREYCGVQILETTTMALTFIASEAKYAKAKWPTFILLCLGRLLSVKL